MRDVLTWLLAQPGLFDLITTVAVALVAGMFYRLTGRTLEARSREDLHSALATIASTIAARGLSGPVVGEIARDYLRQSVPGALRTLRPSDQVLDTLIESKVAQAKTQAPQQA